MENSQSPTKKRRAQDRLKNLQQNMNQPQANSLFGAAISILKNMENKPVLEKVKRKSIIPGQSNQNSFISNSAYSQNTNSRINEREIQNQVQDSLNQELQNNIQKKIEAQLKEQNISQIIDNEVNQSILNQSIQSINLQNDSVYQDGNFKFDDDIPIGHSQIANSIFLQNSEPQTPKKSQMILKSSLFQEKNIKVFCVFCSKFVYEDQAQNDNQFHLGGEHPLILISEQQLKSQSFMSWSKQSIYDLLSQNSEFQKGNRLSKLNKGYFFIKNITQNFENIDDQNIERQEGILRVLKNQMFSKTWTLLNVGDKISPQNMIVRIVCMDKKSPFYSIEKRLQKEILSGETFQVSFDFQAPSQASENKIFECQFTIFVLQEDPQPQKDLYISNQKESLYLKFQVVNMDANFIVAQHQISQENNNDIMQSLQLNSMMRENQTFNDPWVPSPVQIENTMRNHNNEEQKQSTEQQDFFDFLEKIQQGTIDFNIDGQEIKKKTRRYITIQKDIDKIKEISLQSKIYDLKIILDQLKEQTVVPPINTINDQQALYFEFLEKVKNGEVNIQIDEREYQKNQMLYKKIQAKIDQIKILALQTKIYNLSENWNAFKNKPRNDQSPYQENSNLDISNIIQENNVDQNPVRHHNYNENSPQRSNNSPNQELLFFKDEKQEEDMMIYLDDVKKGRINQIEINGIIYKANTPKLNKFKSCIPRIIEISQQLSIYDSIQIFNAFQEANYDLDKTIENLKNQKN